MRGDKGTVCVSPNKKFRQNGATRGITVKTRLLKFRFGDFIPLLLWRNWDRNTVPFPKECRTFQDNSEFSALAVKML